MITYVYGDLFTSPARVLVNPVNTVGTMSGDQGEVFRSVYPAMFACVRLISFRSARRSCTALPINGFSTSL